MKVLQVNGTWDDNGSFKVRNLQHISLSSPSQPDMAETIATVSEASASDSPTLSEASASDSPTVPSGSAAKDGGTYNDWNTVTNILRMIIQSLLLYQSADGYIYVSADGYAYTNKK